MAWRKITKCFINVWLVQLFSLAFQAEEVHVFILQQLCLVFITAFFLWLREKSCFLSLWVFREILWKIKIRPMLTQGIWGDEGEFGSHWTLGVFTGICWKKQEQTFSAHYKELPLPTQCINSSPLITEAGSINKKCFWQLGLSAWKSLPCLLTFKNTR